MGLYLSRHLDTGAVFQVMTSLIMEPSCLVSRVLDQKATQVCINRNMCCVIFYKPCRPCPLNTSAWYGKVGDRCVWPNCIQIRGCSPRLWNTVSRTHKNITTHDLWTTITVYSKAYTPHLFYVVDCLLHHHFVARQYVGAFFVVGGGWWNNFSSILQQSI